MGVGEGRIRAEGSVQSRVLAHGQTSRASAGFARFVRWTVMSSVYALMRCVDNVLIGQPTVATVATEETRYHRVMFG